MDLILSVACEDAHVRPDGKLDIEGVFNELSAPGFPASQDRMVVVFVVEWGDEEGGRQPLRAELLAEDGRSVLTIQGHTDLAPDRGRPRHTRLVMPLENVVFPRAGRYRFHLEAAGERRPAFSIFLHEQPGD